MNTSMHTPGRCAWQWPVDRTQYDRTQSLNAVELATLETFVRAV